MTRRICAWSLVLLALSPFTAPYSTRVLGAAHEATTSSAAATDAVIAAAPHGDDDDRGIWRVSAGVDVVLDTGIASFFAPVPVPTSPIHAPRVRGAWEQQPHHDAQRTRHAVLRL